MAAAATADDYTVEVLITPPQAAKSIFGALEKLVTDVNMHFTSKGMSIISMNTSETVLVYLLLDATKLAKYACRKEHHTVGINVPNLYKKVHALTPGEAIKFASLTRNGTLLWRLETRIEHLNKHIVLDMNTKDIPELVEGLTKQDYPLSVTMRSSDFQNTIKEVSVFAEDFVTITVYANRLAFSGVNESDGASGVIGMDHNTTVSATADGAAAKAATAADADVVLCEDSYALRHLQMFAKAVSSLDETVTLYMNRGQPLFIEVNACDLGVMKVALAPRNRDDEEEATAAAALGADAPMGDAAAAALAYKPE